MRAHSSPGQAASALLYIHARGDTERTPALSPWGLSIRAIGVSAKSGLRSLQLPFLLSGEFREHGYLPVPDPSRRCLFPSTAGTVPSYQ